MGIGLWRDEKRRPGPLPDGKRALLALVAVVAGVAVRVFVHGAAVGIGLVAVGLGVLWWTVRLTPERHRETRFARWPGWDLAS